jgi:uncharacterized protein (TIRG00374 family)
MRGNVGLAKKLGFTLLKIGASGALIAWLIYKAAGSAQSSQIDWQNASINWNLMAAGWAATLGCLVITIVRWYYLVRALDIPFRLRDAFRLGFLGYMLNFVALGSVGGDFFRAVFIAREAKNHRAEAVATVLIDRIIGLYILFVMAAIAIWLNGLMDSSVPEIRAIVWLSWLSTVLGGVGIVMLLVPGFTTGALSESLRSVPRVGPTIYKLIGAVRIYRKRPGVLAWVSLLTVLVHSLCTLGVYLIARSIVVDVPSLAEHFVIVPLAMVAGALPLPMMGLGAVEAVMDVLYRNVPAVVHPTTVEVLKICVAYRIIQIADALIGAVIWLFSRREVADIMHEAELEAGPIEVIEDALAELDSAETTRSTIGAS